MRTEGIVAGWLVYADVDALYLAAQRTWDQVEPIPYRHVGTYPQTATSVLHNRVVRAEVTGVVRTCAELHGPNVMMVLGYCHHYSGPFLQVARIAQRSGLITRRAGEAERVRIGTLGFAPAEWADYAAAEAVAREWLRSIQVRDLEAYARLVDHDLDLSDIDSVEHYVFEARRSPFREFRGSRGAPQFAMFVYKPPGAATATLEEATTYREVEACFCRRPNCDDRWPISLLDAGNQDRRPYICANIFDAADEEDSTRRWIVRVELDWDVMREPR